MKALTSLFLLILLATGCNVEEKSGGGLIAGHVPVKNSFTLSLPSIKSYKEGTDLDFYLTFPYSVKVIGTPRLVLKIGNTTRYATYLIGNGTTELAFRYTVQAGENDSNGITINDAVDLNGGALTFVGTAGLDDCNLELTIPNTSGIKVDTSAPTITSVIGPSNRTYYKNQIVSLVMHASEAIFVSGSPRIAITLGSGLKYAAYASGSGTSALTFQYSVAHGDLDLNGIVISSPVQLNGGILRDSAGNMLIQTFVPPNTSNVLVDGNTPYVTSITSPGNGTYTFGQQLNYTFTFSEPVTVSGTPTVIITIGSTQRLASYASGSGTSSLVFTYVVQGNDVDTNGVVLGTSFDLTSATIQDASSDNALNSFLASPTPNVKVSAPSPYILSFTINARTYVVGQTINVYVMFSQAVSVTGSPRIQIDVGGVTRHATYVSGTGTTTLRFAMSVINGDSDTNGVQLSSPVDLNGGTISGTVSTIDAATGFSPPSTPNVKVDGIVPTVSSITYPTNQTWNTGQVLNYTLTFNETVYVTNSGSLKLDLIVGATPRQASYFSGSGTNSLVFRYTVLTADTDTDGVQLLSPINTTSGTARIADISGSGNGNTANYVYSPAATPNVLVNSGYPQVVTVDSPANGYYKYLQDMDFTLHLSEAVNVTGTPRIQLTVGAATLYANYNSGTGSDTLVFRYSVQSGHLDTDGIVAATSISLNGGTIRNLTNTIDSGTSVPAQMLTGVLVDGVVPTISNVTAPSNGTYTSGQFLDFTATFSEAVTIVGSPRIALDIDGTPVYATYDSGSPGTSIVFRYTVQNGNVDMNGIGNSSPIDLNGGSIRDVASNDSALTFTAPNTTGVNVQGTNPTIVSVSAPANGNYVSGVQWDINVTTSDAATVDTTGGTPRIALTIGATTRYATYVSGSGTTTLIFSYTTQTGDNDADGIALPGTIDLNGGTIQYLGINFALTFTNPNTSLVRVDTTMPSISSVNAPANSTYGNGANLDFTVNFSEVANVTGTPRLELTIGSTTRYATYQSGSGTTAWLFRYTVVSGEEDTNGIALVSTLDLDGGAVKDGFLNDLSPLTFTGPNTTGVLVDSLAPTITSVTGPANGSYKQGTNLDFSVVFSEAVIIAGANPTIPLTIGATSVNAAYISGSNSNTLIFRYTIQAAQTDIDGISSASPVATAGTIRDSNNNNAVLTFTPPDTTLVLVDTTAPSISSMSSSPAGGTYQSGQQLNFTLTFSETVIVDTTSGTPRLSLTIGSTTRYATYISGTGSSALNFRYTVQNGDYDSDGIVVASPLSLNGGSIADAALNTTGLTYTPPSLATVIVDAVLPVISSITAPGNAAYKNGSLMSFTLNTNKIITVNTAGGTPRMVLTVGSSTLYANYASGSGTQSLIFNYSPGTTDLDLDGVAISGATLSLNGGTLRDALNNNLDLTYPTIPSLSGVFVVYPAFQHWYDLDDSSRVNFTNDGTGDAINSISDILGGSNLTASTTARPYYNSSGFGSANRGFMKFDGSNDSMAFVTSPDIKQIIFVFRSHSSTAVTSGLFGQSAGPTGQRKKIEMSSGSLALTVSGDYSVNGSAFSSSALTHSWAWAANTNYILTTRWSASNNRALTIGNNAGSNHFNGRIAAIIVLDDTSTALTGAEYTALYNFLSARYGVP